MKKALELLQAHEEELGRGSLLELPGRSAYYYLDEEGPALHYFERALKHAPGIRTPRSTSKAAETL